MMRIVAIISFVSLIFIGCGEEKDFMTHSAEVAVIDISSKDILLNGEKIGDTFNDIENESQTLMIRSLERKIKTLNFRPKKAHIHIARVNSFKILFRSVASVNWLGFDSVSIVLGDDFKTPIVEYISKEPNPCSGPRGIVRELLKMNSEKNLSAEEKYDKRVQELNRDHECAENFMELDFSLYKSKDSLFKSSRINEIGLIDSKKATSFNDDKEVETYFKEIRSRESLANKKDKDVVTFACSKNLLTDEYALYLKLLAKMSYRIKFAQME